MNETTPAPPGVKLGAGQTSDPICTVSIARWDQTCAEAIKQACLLAFPDCQITLFTRALDTLDHLRDHPVDLLLLGMNFTDLDGLDLLEYVTAHHLASRVIIATERRNEHTINFLRTAKFDGYFDTAIETIPSMVPALRAVAAGRDYISRSLRPLLIEAQSASVLAQKLTAAEINVFCVIGDGSSDTEASEMLGLSKSTVQTHRRNIMRKLDVNSSAKLVCEAVRLGVIRVASDGSIIRPSFRSNHAAVSAPQISGYAFHPVVEAHLAAEVT